MAVIDIIITTALAVIIELLIRAGVTFIARRIRPRP